MNIKFLTVEDYMKVNLITKTFKENDKVYREKIIEHFDGNLDIPLDEAAITFNSLNKALKEEYNLVQKFTLNGVKYGFIPDLENITTGEYIDLEEYTNNLDLESRYDRIMAILYRPITKELGKKYRIEKYEGTDKYVDVMKKVDHRVLKSALGFFLTLNEILSRDLNTST